MSYNLVFDLEELRERVDEVNPLDARATVDAIKAKLKKYPNLYALSAPQIGIKERVIVIKYKGDKFKEYINPRIFKAEDYHLIREKDISSPEKEFISLRPGKVFIEYQTKDAVPENNVLKGNSAEVFDRLINYLDGLPLEDYGLEVMPGFDEATEEERQEIINMYLESLKKRHQLIEENISQDKDARELRDAIRFMAAVEKGEVKLEPMDAKPKEDENKQVDNVC